MWDPASGWDSAGVRRRLAAMAAGDRRLRAFGVAGHGYQVKRPLREADVEAFERRHGVVLPVSYRQFLLQVGDGGAGPGYGLYALDGREMHEPWYADWWDLPGFLRTPFPHEQDWDGDADADGDDDPWLGAGTLPIATLGCTMNVLLVVTGSRPGQVWMDDRGADGGIRILADDFAGWYLEWLAKDPVLPPRR